MARIPFPKGVSEMGHIVTDSTGMATVTFIKAYPTKPKVALTPELSHAVDQISVQIEGWTISDGKYVGMALGTYDDGGKAEPNVPVHYLVFI
ncbi:MAG: hypothetical protein QW175_05390 [Candidatus Bathyarchaeia archaeon]